MHFTLKTHQISQRNQFKDKMISSFKHPRARASYLGGLSVDANCRCPLPNKKCSKDLTCLERKRLNRKKVLRKKDIEAGSGASLLECCTRLFFSSQGSTAHEKRVTNTLSGERGIATKDASFRIIKSYMKGMHLACGT